MSTTIQLVEKLAVLATIDPADHDTTAATSDWVDMAEFDQVVAILSLGVISGTFDFKLQEATDSSGTGNVDISGKAITQIADTGDAGQALINCRSEELSTGFTHVACVMTPTGGVASFASAVILGGHSAYKPASDNDLASVAEIIN